MTSAVTGAVATTSTAMSATKTAGEEDESSVITFPSVSELRSEIVGRSQVEHPPVRPFQFEELSKGSSYNSNNNAVGPMGPILDKVLQDHVILLDHVRLLHLHLVAYSFPPLRGRGCAAALELAAEDLSQAHELLAREGVLGEQICRICLTQDLSQVDPACPDRLLYPQRMRVEVAEFPQTLS